MVHNFNTVFENNQATLPLEIWKVCRVLAFVCNISLDLAIIPPRQPLALVSGSL